MKGICFYNHSSTNTYLRFVAIAVHLSVLALLSSCGADSIELPENELAGQIEGNDWSYGAANAFRRTANGQYEVRFISNQESPTDPCSLPIPGLTHVRAIFTPGFGSFAVSPIAIDNNQIQVIFQVSPAKAITANSGFLEVFDIRGGVIIGYLQASEDADNTFVEGRVEIAFCD